MANGNINDGGPAFPIGTYEDRQGMSLRDWFAGQAIGSVVIQCAADLRFLEGMTAAEYFAKKAYEISDAMIAARKAGA